LIISTVQNFNELLKYNTTLYYSKYLFLGIRRKVFCNLSTA